MSSIRRTGVWCALLLACRLATGEAVAQSQVPRLVFEDADGRPLLSANEAASSREAGRAAIFQALSRARGAARGGPACEPNAAPGPSVRADAYVDTRLAAYRDRSSTPAPDARAGIRGEGGDPSWRLVGTGLVKEALDPAASADIARLLSEPEVAPYLAHPRANRAQLGFLIRYARARARMAQVHDGLPAASESTPGTHASATVPSVPATPTTQPAGVQPGAGGGTATHVEEVARLAYTLAYFKKYPSLGGVLHKQVMRWLIDSRRLERFAWWNVMNKHLYEDLGHTPLWIAYQQTFAHPTFEPLREKRYIAAHNDDLDTGKVLAHDFWHALPLPEKILADAIMEAAYAGGDVLHLLPMAVSSH